MSVPPWVFILGIAVFSIGEMTAYPKYYSFVGEVAPADRKAVYMGYAFLYGVFGSLLGSSLGAYLYERMLKPVVATPEREGGRASRGCSSRCWTPPAPASCCSPASSGRALIFFMALGVGGLAMSRAR